MKELADQLLVEFRNKEYAHGYVNQFYDIAIAAQIKALREQHGWSQEELAKAASMKQERISLLENVDYDAWTMKTLRQLGEAFDVVARVSFVGFSDAIVDVINLRAEKLTVPEREQSLDNFSTKRLITKHDGDWGAFKSLGEVQAIKTTPPISTPDTAEWSAVTRSMARST